MPFAVADRSRSRNIDAKWGKVRVVGRNDGGALVVVARIENVSDGVPDPVRGLGRADLVEDEDLRIEDRLQDAEFGRCHRGVVGVLYLLQELAVVVKEPLGSPLDERLQNTDGQMRLSYADISRQEQSCAIRFKRIGLDELLGRDVRVRERGRGRTEFGFEALQRAVFVPFWNSGLQQRTRVTVRHAAAARLGEAIAIGPLDEAKEGALAERADRWNKFWHRFQVSLT